MNKFQLEYDYRVFYDWFSVKLRRKIKEEFNINYLKIANEYDHIEIYPHFLKVSKGFRWDGCSPKIKLFGIWIGTPDGSIDTSGKQRMYYPSCLHDVLYKNLEVIPFSRKTVDLMFYELAKSYGFKFSGLYYCGVRLLGGIYHNIARFCRNRQIYNSCKNKR